MDKTTKTIADTGNHAIERGGVIKRLGHTGRGRSMGQFVKGPNKLFTANKNIILAVADRLCETKTRDALNSIIRIVSP